MNPIKPSSQPLPLTPLVWIALGVIALIGSSRWMRDDDSKRRGIDLFQHAQVLVVRSQQSTHDFPELGIEITLPEGWTYLTVSGLPLANRPTFVNVAAQTIVRIAALPPDTWPEDAGAVTLRSGVEWMEPGQRQLVMTIEPADLQLKWIEKDPRSLGRLHQGDCQLAIIAVTHTDTPQTNASLESFCKAIRFSKT